MGDRVIGNVHIALLRGVNVGGNPLPMNRLRALCGELGAGNARTYVQSGNLIFEAEGSAAHWSEALERALAGETRLPVAVFARTEAEMARVVERNPFPRRKGVDPARLYVTFLGKAPAKPALAALHAIDAGADKFHVAGREIYLHCPNGYGRSKLSNNVVERALKTAATTRNWRTVTALAAMAAE